MKPVIRRSIEEKVDAKIGATEREKKRGRPKKEEKLSESELDAVIKKLTEKSTDWGRASLFLSVLGIIVVIFAYQTLEAIKGFQILMFIFGMMGFLPVGFILGWFLTNPYIRCKIRRKMTKKDYAVINFFHKDAKRFDTRIKNLDFDVIVQGTKLWLLKRGRIYAVSSDMSKIFHKSIEPEHIKTSPFDVPVVFVDVESMTPLTFFREETETNPQQGGATILGYINNQKAKAMRQRSLTFFYIVMLAMAALTLTLVISM